MWCPQASPVVRSPKTRNGCAEAWYFTSFLIGSGRKNLNWKICGKMSARRTLLCRPRR